jgi:hypothetical protein
MLSPYERWMVNANLETIRSTTVTADEQVALLQANGYPRVAQAVAEATSNAHQAMTNPKENTP